MNLVISFGEGTLIIPRENIAHMTAHVNPMTEVGTVDITLHKRIEEIRHMNLQLGLAPMTAVKTLIWYVEGEEDYEITDRP